MSEEAKIIAFVAFCVECYKHAKNRNGNEVAVLFSEYGVDRYLHDEYDVLHTMGERDLVDDIDGFLAVRGGKHG